LPKPSTLWDRLGREKGVTQIVADLTAVAAKNPTVDLTRGGKFQLSKDDVAKFKKEMVDWVSDKTGGPFRYTGESMKKAHKGMGITDAQFDALVDDLKGVLAKNGVMGEDAHAVVDAVEATRKDIVEKKAEEEPEKKPEDKKPEEKKNGETKSGEKKPEEKQSAEDKKTEGKKAEATVTGHVVFKGKPVAGGTITLTAKDGTVTSGTSAEDGTFAVEGVKPGTYVVTVKSSDDKKKAVPVPEKYGDPQKSPLAYEAKEGPNVLNIELE
jgi:hemoglobin